MRKKSAVVHYVLAFLMVLSLVGASTLLLTITASMVVVAMPAIGGLESQSTVCPQSVPWGFYAVALLRHGLPYPENKTFFGKFGLQSLEPPSFQMNLPGV